MARVSSFFNICEPFRYSGPFKPLVQVQMERSLIDGWLCGGESGERGERGERGESDDRERGKARERARRCSYWFCGAPSAVQILPAGVLDDSATKSATALDDASAPQFIRCDRCRSVVRVYTSYSSTTGTCKAKYVLEYTETVCHNAE